MMGGPGGITAYLQKNSELSVNTGFLIGHDIIFQRLFDAGTSNYNQLESIKNHQVCSTMGLSSVESYALFCMKLPLPQFFCAKKSGNGGMISHSDRRPTTGRVLGGIAHELENKLGEIISSYETAIRQNYSPSDLVQAVWLNVSLEYLHVVFFAESRKATIMTSSTAIPPNGAPASSPSPSSHGQASSSFFSHREKINCFVVLFPSFSGYSNPSFQSSSLLRIPYAPCYHQGT